MIIRIILRVCILCDHHRKSTVNAVLFLFHLTAAAVKYYALCCETILQKIFFQIALKNASVFAIL